MFDLSERLRHNIESQKKSEMEYNEKMAQMAEADKNRQLAEHRKVRDDDHLIQLFVYMPFSFCQKLVNHQSAYVF